jgi:hypothetical protein
LKQGINAQTCCAAPLDLILNLRRLKQIIRKSTVEEERAVIEKALRKSEMLELSEDGQRIHNKDIKSECAYIVTTSLLACGPSVLVSLLYHHSQSMKAAHRVGVKTSSQGEYETG